MINTSIFYKDESLIHLDYLEFFIIILTQLIHKK